MNVGVLTAALQELTPRAVRDPDPDRAVEEWAEFARELNADCIQLSAALHPSETDVPPEAMLDPVANTLDLRKPFDKNRARRVESALKASSIGLSDIAYFDNMLHHDPEVRRKKHDLMLRVFDAAALLGLDAVCGFVGRNQQHNLDENLLDFEVEFVPLLKAAKARGLTYRVEHRTAVTEIAGSNKLETSSRLNLVKRWQVLGAAVRTLAIDDPRVLALAPAADPRLSQQSLQITGHAAASAVTRPYYPRICLRAERSA